MDGNLVSGGGDDIWITFIPPRRNFGGFVHIAQDRKQAAEDFSESHWSGSRAGMKVTDEKI